MVEKDRSLGRDVDVGLVPGGGKGLVVLHAGSLGVAIERGQTLGVVVLDPGAGTEALVEGDHAEAFTSEGGDDGQLSHDGQLIEPLDLLCHVLEVKLDRGVVTEVECLFQYIAVCIPLTVEVSVDEPLRLEDTLGGVMAHADGVQEKVLELVVGDPILVAGTDVVESSEEVVGDVVRAHTLHEGGRVFDGGPFQNAVQRDVEHDRVHVFEDLRIEDAGLTQGDPLLQTGLSEDALRFDLGNGIVVIDGDFDRVSATAPVHGLTAVTGLGDGADVDDGDVVGVLLCLDSLDDVLGSHDVGLEGSLRPVVSCGGDHAADVQDIARAGDAFQDGIVVAEVAPDDLDSVIVQIAVEELVVLLGISDEDGDGEVGSVPVDLLEGGPAHVAGSTGDEDLFVVLCHWDQSSLVNNLFEQFYYTVKQKRTQIVFV